MMYNSGVDVTFRGSLSLGCSGRLFCLSQHCNGMRKGFLLFLGKQLVKAGPLRFERVRQAILSLPLCSQGCAKSAK